MLLVNPTSRACASSLPCSTIARLEVSRTYLETVLASPGIPPEVRSRAEQYRGSREAQQPLAFVAILAAALPVERQSRSADPNVRLFGQTANPNQSALGTADWGGVTSGYVRHTILAARTGARSRRSSAATPTASSSSRRPTCRSWT
jgi:hypothetical protein